MSTPKRHPRSRALRPAPEALETRQLLSNMLTGLDGDGDRWILRLNGPGTLAVTKQGGGDLGAATEIATITIAATDLDRSRLEGQVIPAEGGDGRVFFQNLIQTGGRSLDPLDPNQTFTPQVINDGVLAVDLPNFWLGSTGLALGAGDSPSIDIPDGVITLRFGGVDTTFVTNNPAATSPNANAQSDSFDVNLGIPATRGTSIIIDRAIAGAQAAVAPATTGTQDSVTFTVDGRINLFQANAIQFQANPGDSADQIDALTPGQFANVNPGAEGNAAGGTFVISQGVGAGSGQPISASIGNLRVGGDATNLTVAAFFPSTLAGLGVPPPEAPNARVSNFSIGGETNNVVLVAPGGSRNVFFGRGMDRVDIHSLYISHLQANRGALDSSVTVTRQIGRAIFGGDVVNTEVQSGYAQGLEVIAQNATSGQASATISNRVADGRGTFSPLAQRGGRMNVLIAGDVVDSIFSASVEPNPANDGTPGTIGDLVLVPNAQTPDGRLRVNDVILPGGMIHAKVEGTINNQGLVRVDDDDRDPATTLFVGQEAADQGQAFFANVVRVRPGPVVPPDVPEPPFPRGGGIAPRAPRVVRPLLPARPRTRNRT